MGLAEALFPAKARVVLNFTAVRPSKSPSRMFRLAVAQKRGEGPASLPILAVARFHRRQMAVAPKTGTKRGCPGKWKHGPKTWSNRFLLFNFEPHPNTLEKVTKPHELLLLFSDGLPMPMGFQGSFL